MESPSKPVDGSTFRTGVHQVPNSTGEWFPSLLWPRSQLTQSSAAAKVHLPASFPLHTACFSTPPNLEKFQTHATSLSRLPTAANPFSASITNKPPSKTIRSPRPSCATRFCYSASPASVEAGIGKKFKLPPGVFERVPQASSVTGEFDAIW